MKKNYNLLNLLFLIVLLTISCKEQKKTEAVDLSYDPELRLQELNIILPSPPQPVANYVNGVRTGNLIFLAGKVQKVLKVLN